MIVKVTYPGKSKEKELLVVHYHNDISCILGYLKYKDKREREFIIGEVMRAVGLNPTTEYHVKLN